METKSGARFGSAFLLPFFDPIPNGRRQTRVNICCYVPNKEVKLISTKGQTITKDQFITMTRPLIGMPVSRTWRGHGSAIFLELGELAEIKSPTKRDPNHVRIDGEVTIMIQWSWRVERLRSISFGSWSGNGKITNGVRKLQGSSILDISSEGRLPELVVQLSSGLWLHSFMTTDSQPEWALLFRQGEHTQRWIHVMNGKIRLEHRKSL